MMTDGVAQRDRPQMVWLATIYFQATDYLKKEK